MSTSDAHLDRADAAMEIARAKFSDIDSAAWSADGLLQLAQAHALVSIAMSLTTIERVLQYGVVNVRQGA